MMSRLSCGRQHVVGEHGHLLRTGEQSLEDVLAARLADVGGVLATRQGAAGAGEVVAGGAVLAEQCSAAGELAAGGPAGVVVGLRRGGRAGCEGGDVGGELVDLLLGVDPRLLGGLHPGGGQRHPTGADLEVDGGGADPGQRGTVLAALLRGDALGAQAVARGAPDLVEGTALGGRVSVALLGPGGVGRRESGVRPPGHEQPQQEHHRSGEPSASPPGDDTGHP